MVTAKEVQTMYNNLYNALLLLRGRVCPSLYQVLLKVFNRVLLGYHTLNMSTEKTGGFSSIGLFWGVSMFDHKNFPLILHNDDGNVFILQFKKCVIYINHNGVACLDYGETANVLFNKLISELRWCFDTGRKYSRMSSMMYAKKLHTESSYQVFFEKIVPEHTDFSKARITTDMDDW